MGVYTLSNNSTNPVDYESLANIKLKFLNYNKVFTTGQIEEADRWADFMYNTQGLNTIPVISKNKKGNILKKWNRYTLPN